DAHAHARGRGLDGWAVARHAPDAVTVSERVPLAPLTTLGVGGAARWFVEAADEATVRSAHAGARERGVPLRVLGGGSNLVVAEAGVDALVVRIVLRGITHRERGGAVEVTAAAGESWDRFVATTVDRGWAGLGCARSTRRRARWSRSPRPTAASRIATASSSARPQGASSCWP